MHMVEQKGPDKSEILLAIAGTSVIILTWSFAIKWSLSKVRLILVSSSVLGLSTDSCASMPRRPHSHARPPEPHNKASQRAGAQRTCPT